MSIGRKLMVGPSLTLHGGWQLVPLHATRQYGVKDLYLVASTSAAVTLSTDAESEFVLPAGKVLRIDMAGAPLSWAKGTDLVSDGAFASTGSWFGTGWAVDGGSAAHAAATGQTQALGQTLAIADDTIYEVTFDISANPGRTGETGVHLSLGGDTSTQTYGQTGAAFKEVFHTANATGPLRFVPNASGSVVSVDDVSAKELTGSQLLFAKGTAGVILQVMFTI